MQNGKFDKPFDMKQVPISTQPITTSAPPKKSDIDAELPVKKEEKSNVSRQELFARMFIFIVCSYNNLHLKKFRKTFFDP